MCAPLSVQQKLVIRPTSVGWSEPLLPEYNNTAREIPVSTLFMWIQGSVSFFSVQPAGKNSLCIPNYKHGTQDEIIERMIIRFFFAC